MEFTGAEIDTLVALVESGPVWDGDVPSKNGRDTLIARGLGVEDIAESLRRDGFLAGAWKLTEPKRDATASRPDARLRCCHSGVLLPG